MNSKQRKTLVALFAKPTASTLEWARIEALQIAAGCVMVEGPGSRVRFVRGLNVRVPPEVHSAALIAAQAAGTSLNQWAAKALSEAAQAS